MRNSENSRSELVKLKDLDNLLKCGICYEYLKTTLITPCSHNYCSYCIRQSLSYRNQCPSCFEDINESQLRNNRVVDEFITIFTCIKEKLHKFLNNLPISKTKDENPKANEEPSVKGNNKDVVEDNVIKHSSRNTSFSGSVDHGCSPIMPSTSKKEVLIPSMFSPKKAKSSNISEEKAPCPVCYVEIPVRNINIHLDDCLRRSHEKSVPRAEKRKLLPKLVYHLLPDKDLRKKLNDLGLNNIGDRTTLINRHKRYTVLYNSECDSLKPRPVSEIIKQLKKEEEEEKKLTPVVKKLNVDRKADPQVNEEAQRQYIQEHKSSFEKLIEEARRNKEAKRIDNSLEEAGQKIITIDDSSETSDSEFKIKSFSHKRKLITSDSENTDDENELPRVLTESKLPKELLDEQKSITFTLNVSNKENEEISTKVFSPGIEIKQPNIYTDSTDEMDTDEDFAESGSQVISKDKRKKKSSNGNHTLQPQTSFNLQPLVTSPVLVTKSRLNRTPKRITGQTNSFKKNLIPDLKSPREHVPSSPGSAAGQLPEEDVVDSDSSSNHSTSLMVYTGPECGNSCDTSSPVKTPNKNNDQPITTPTCKQTNFDLGINEILQNTEEFITLPSTRKSTRIKESKKDVPEPKTKGRVTRKRVRIDDL